MRTATPPVDESSYRSPESIYQTPDALEKLETPAPLLPAGSAHINWKTRKPHAPVGEWIRVAVLTRTLFRFSLGPPALLQHLP